MSSQRPMSRRRAALAMIGSVLVRPWRRMKDVLGIAAAAAAAGSARAQPRRDPELLVRLYSTDDQILRGYLKHSRIEVLRYTPPPDQGKLVSALVLMRRSATIRARLPDRINVEIVAEPPRSEAEVPRVGKGNRYDDPAVRPQGRGVLLR